MKADFPAHVFFCLLYSIQDKGFQPICICPLGKNLPAEFSTEFRQRCWCWTHYRTACPFCVMVHISPQSLGSQYHFLLHFSSDEHRENVRKRRLLHCLPQEDFLLIKSFVILCRRHTDSVVFRLVSLNEHPSGKLSSSCSASRLGNELKTIFRCLIGT